MLVLSFVYGHSLNIRKCSQWPGTWQCVKNSNELVDRAAFIDSVGILRADLIRLLKCSVRIPWCKRDCMLHA